MSEKITKHPLNAAGKYYVEYEICLDQECCADEAPDIFKMDRSSWGAYVYKQPQTIEEEAQCQAALRCCPVEAIRDDGEIFQDDEK